MTRTVAENTNNLSVFFLKKYGYLSKWGNRRCGGIKWTRGDDEESMGIEAKTEKSGGYVELIYTHTDIQSGVKTDMRHKVLLTTTPCYFGGRRYWFLCPKCERRVAVIYGIGKCFECRSCANVAYRSQFEGGDIRVGSKNRSKVEEAYKRVGREYYAGKPTRKYKRYVQLSEKKSAFISMLIEKL